MKKTPNASPQKAGMSISNCISTSATGLVMPPFKYRTRSTSQLSPNVRPRNQPTCSQFTLDGVRTVVGTITEVCEVVAMMISLSLVEEIQP
jgi:hypothetical protein